MRKQDIKVIVKRQLRISYLCLVGIFFISYLVGLISGTDLGQHTTLITYMLVGAIVLLLLISLFIERVLLEIFDQINEEGNVVTNNE